MLSFLFPVGILVVFYFLLLRPQNKRAKEHEAMIASLETGAEVVVSGILGKVVELSEQFATVEISDGVQVKVQRSTIGQVLPKGTLKNV